MTIETNEKEVVFRVSAKIDIDELQDMADYFEYMEIAKKSKAKQKDVDKLVKNVKKGRWEETKNKLNL